jgi:hypothetical protein
MLRLFCAEHVIEEMTKHAEVWASEAGIQLDAYVGRWRTDYLPLIRVVKPSSGLLSPTENERIERLACGPKKYRDPDDVPTATLALQLGAVLLSKDHKPLYAVYGDDVDFDRHTEWLTIIQGGSDSSKAGELSLSAGTGLTVATASLFTALKWIWENVSPLAVFALAGVGGYALYKASPETRRKILDTGSTALDTMSQIYDWYQTTVASFLAVAPQIPSWDELAMTNTPDSVLARSCLHTLTRSQMTDRSAVELSKDLPLLPVAQGSVLVRQVLRERASFELAYRGRWQVGRSTGHNFGAELPNEGQHRA